MTSVFVPKVRWRQYCAQGQMTSVFVPKVIWRQYLVPSISGVSIWSILNLGHWGQGPIFEWSLLDLHSSVLEPRMGPWRTILFFCTCCFSMPPPVQLVCSFSFFIDGTLSHFRRAYLIGSINGALWRCPLAEILHICCILGISGMGDGLDIQTSFDTWHLTGQNGTDWSTLL